MDSDSEEEIFFGPVTAKEEKIAAPLRNRKTEMFVPNSSLLGCRSSVPSLSSLEEEDYKTFSSNSEQYERTCDSHWTESKDKCDINKLTHVFQKETDKGSTVSTSNEDTVSLSSKNDVFAVDENNEMHSSTVSEDEKITKSNVILFRNEEDLSSIKVSKETSDIDYGNVSEGNIFEVSKGIAASLSLGSTEVSEDESQSEMVNEPKVIIQDSVIPSTRSLAPANKDITEVLLLSSSDVGELSQEELNFVPKAITAMLSPSKCSIGDISSCSSVRVQEKVAPMFDDKIINSEDIMEVESANRKSDVYIPALRIETEEYITLNNNRKFDDEADSVACLSLDENRSVSAAEIIKESKLTVTSANVADAETMNTNTADVFEYANKHRDGDENVTRLVSDLNVLALKCDLKVASVIEEKLPSETSGSSFKTDAALFDYKEYKNASEIHDPKDLKDPVSIDNHFSLCFCNDIEAGVLLTDKSKENCVCGKKSSMENQQVGCNGGSDNVFLCASEKQISVVIGNFPSQWSAVDIDRDTGCSLESGLSSVNDVSDYPRSIDSSSESYDVINKGLIFSQTPSLESDLVASCTNDCSPVLVKRASTECDLRSVPFVNSSNSSFELESISFEKPIPCNDRDESNMVVSPNSSLDVSDDERQSEVGSPARRFNDTIEEMELLLKYGVNYGETGVSSNKCSDTDDKKRVNFEVDCGLDDSIVSPRKSSIMSSVSHFDPEFNSTSVPTTKYYAVPVKLEENVESHEIQELNANLGQLKVTNPLMPSALSKETKALSPAPVPKETKPLSPAPVPKETKALSPAPVRKETKALFPAPVPKETKALSPAPVPKETKALSPAPVRKETKALPPPKPPRNAFMSSPSPLRANSVPKAPSHLTPNLQQGKRVLREDVVVRHVISKSNPNTPKSTPRRLKPSTPQYTRVKSSGILPQKLESRTPNKTPSKIAGVVRSTSLTNMSKESRLCGSVPVSPLCGPFSHANVASGQNTPKSQTQRSTAKDKLLNTGKKSNTPLSTPSRLVRKPPTGHPSKTRQKVKALTPNPLAKKQAYIRQAGMNIVSPVARYLREHPPPTLVINVKPQNKTTGNIEKVTQMEGIKASPESADAKCREATQWSKHAPVLPVALYSPAVPVLLEKTEDKENERSRKLQEISSSSQHSLVVKHKGRIEVPKVKFNDEVNKNSTPKGYKIPNPVEAAVTPIRNSSVRGSLMEVSIYEPHRIQYTDTLK